MGRGKVRALFETTDRLFRDTLKGGYDDDFPWKAIQSLRKNGSYLVFNRAAVWCSSSNPLKRARAAAILSQLGKYDRGRYNSRKEFRHPEWLFRAQSFELITSMLTRETVDQALESEISALGHIDKPAAVPFIAAYANHSDENVRFSVAFALGCYPNEPLSVEVLQKLMDDVDRDVRDWAIFGLGVQGNADSEQIRLKFLDHLEDSFLDAQIEAAATLGKRHDARLAIPLVQMLKKNGALYGIVEAARELLELDEDPEGWSEAEYIAEIEHRYPLTQ